MSLVRVGTVRMNCLQLNYTRRLFQLPQPASSCHQFRGDDGLMIKQVIMPILVMEDPGMTKRDNRPCYQNNSTDDCLATVELAAKCGTQNVKKQDDGGAGTGFWISSVALPSNRSPICRTNFEDYLILDFLSKNCTFCTYRTCKR